MRHLILAAALLAPTVALAARGDVTVQNTINANLPPMTTHQVKLPLWHNPRADWDVCFIYQAHGKPLTLTVKVNGRVITARGEVCLNMPHEPKGAR